ncbi:hypothetical protein ACFSBZ_12975 [Amnibacterium flavum]|uniref:hypothetical protein n=1 Tax=Amnibacterium flavum TaxID=2173173 RepID=UPI0014034BF7|nr:hypothetical protein [Amnibacterium flavum]
MDWLILVVIAAVVLATISLLAALRRIAVALERIADTADGRRRDGHGSRES